MNRREFVGGLAGAVAWPLKARAQQAIPVIGVLHSGSLQANSTVVVGALKQGLKEAGYLVGRDVALEFRWADGNYQQLPSMAAELVDSKVAAIAAMGSTAPAAAAKAATTTIPIVFLSGTDPVDAGIVQNLARPGGNLTGVTWNAAGLEGKRLGLLQQTLPGIADVAVLTNPSFSAVQKVVKDAREAARELGIRIHSYSASTEQEIDTLFASFAQQRPDALLISADPYFYTRMEQLVMLAERLRLPAIYYVREYTSAGGLMSYGTSLDDAVRLAGNYLGRILKAEKAGDLPVLQSTKFELVINLKTAKALGLTIPPSLLARADEVIE